MGKILTEPGQKIIKMTRIIKSVLLKKHKKGVQILIFGTPEYISELFGKSEILNNKIDILIAPAAKIYEG
jgi:hypothetical protein